jgi:hypothetical protein
MKTLIILLFTCVSIQAHRITVINLSGGDVKLGKRNESVWTVPQGQFAFEFIPIIETNLVLRHAGTNYEFVVTNDLRLSFSDSVVYRENSEKPTYYFWIGLTTFFSFWMVGLGLRMVGYIGKTSPEL